MKTKVWVTVATLFALALATPCAIPADAPEDISFFEDVENLAAELTPY